MTKKIILVILLISVAISAWYFDFEYIQNQLRSFTAYYASNPVKTIGIFFAIYVAATALSFPGAAILTLLAGALFGLVGGTIIVSFASTIGATLAFLIARFLLGDYLQNKYPNRLAIINKGIDSEGIFYLFAMRLVPVIPFFVVNILMGLTKIKIWTYFWVSQVGMLAGTIAYVFAGQELAKITSIKGILSPTLITAFIILGILPFILKKIIRYFR